MFNVQSYFTFPFFHSEWNVSLGNFIILCPSAHGFMPQLISGDGMRLAQ